MKGVLLVAAIRVLVRSTWRSAQRSCTKRQVRGVQLQTLRLQSSYLYTVLLPSLMNSSLRLSLQRHRRCAGCRKHTGLNEFVWRTSLPACPGSSLSLLRLPCGCMPRASGLGGLHADEGNELVLPLPSGPHSSHPKATSLERKSVAIAEASHTTGQVPTRVAAASSSASQK